MVFLTHDHFLKQFKFDVVVINSVIFYLETYYRLTDNYVCRYYS